VRTPSQPRSEALRTLFWRDEIPEAMYWLEREGFGSKVDVELLERFLSGDEHLESYYLEGLVGAGLLRRRGPFYELTKEGSLHGARLFADDFSEFERAARTACGPASSGDGAMSACGCGCCEEPETARVSACGCGCCEEPETSPETAPAGARAPRLAR
jgi:hypothetical protein